MTITPEQLAEIEARAESITGFDQTRFEFVPAHTEDRGIGTVTDLVHIDDQLVAITEDIAEPYVIADGLEGHVARGIAEHMNATRPMADSIRGLCSALRASWAEVERLRYSSADKEPFVTLLEAVKSERDATLAEVERLGRFEDCYRAIDNVLTGVVVTSDDLTGQPCVDRILTLRAEVSRLTKERDDARALLAEAKSVLVECIDAEQRAARMYQGGVCPGRAQDVVDDITAALGKETP